MINRDDSAQKLILVVDENTNGGDLDKKPETTGQEQSGIHQDEFIGDTELGSYKQNFGNTKQNFFGI